MKRANKNPTGRLYRPVFKTEAGEVREQETWWWAIPKRYKQGKKSRVTTGMKDRAEAEQWALRRLIELNQEITTGLNTHRHTYERGKEDLRLYHAAKGHPLGMLNGKLKHLDEFFLKIASEPVKDSDPLTRLCELSLLHEYKAWQLGKSVPKNTINKGLAYWRQMLNVAVGHHKLDRNRLPFERGCFTTGKGATRKDVPSDEALNQIIPAMNAWHSQAIEGCLETGWRQGEIRGLQWSMVWRDACVINLAAELSKNRQEGTFAYATWGKLKALMEHQWDVHEELLARGIDSPWVFPSLAPGYEGKQISRWSLCRVWTATKKRLNLTHKDGIRIHGLRRKMVHRLAKLGATPKEIMCVTRHEDAEVMMDYMIPLSGDMAYLGNKLTVSETP